MNCKPGDIAVVIHGWDDLSNVGKLVEVVSQFNLVAEPAWWVRGLSPLHQQGAIVKEGWCADARLRPIRPGDVTDEEVRDLYAPKTKEPA